MYLVGLTGDADLDFGVGDLESDRPGDLLQKILLVRHQKEKECA